MVVKKILSVSMFPYIECFIFAGVYTVLGIGFGKLCPAPRGVSAKDIKTNINYLVSLVHSVVSLIFAFKKLATLGFNFCGLNDYYMESVVAHTTGYFIYDTLICELDGTTDSLMRFHHLFALIAGPAAIMNKHGTSNSINGIIVGESSNPFMISRVILRTLPSGTDHPFYSTIEYSFVTVFLIMRNFVGIYYAYVNYQCIEGPIIVDLANSAIIFLSSFWTVMILSGIGMKFASSFGSKKPLLVGGFVWIVQKISRSLPYKLLFHGIIFSLCTLIPLVNKVKFLLSQ